MKKILLLVAAIVATASLVGVGSARAAGGKALYQVGFSFNCDNKTSPYCAPDAFTLGGEWGWYAFNSDGTGDAQITFCAHGQGFNGAGHQGGDILWTTGAASQPFFGQTSDDFYVSFDHGSTWQDTFIPAAAGHYSAKLAVGVSAEAEVSGA